MLYQKVRPKSFKEIFGNRPVITNLERMVKRKPADRPHTYLFHGPKGCGKTTLAKILAKQFGCDDEMSLIELNAANTKGIDTVRGVAESAMNAPTFGDSKCFIFDESHELTPKAQEALLKVVEDVPHYAYFMFCTTEPGRIINTIRDRCAKYQVMKLRPSELRKLLSYVSEKEGLDLSDEVIEAIAKACDGSPRQSLMLAEQVMDVEDAQDVLEYISSAETASKDVIDLIREVVSGRANSWPKCAKMLKTIQQDAESTRLSMLKYCSKVLLDAKNPLEAGRMCELISIFEKPTYGGGDAILFRQIFEACLLD